MGIKRKFMDAVEDQEDNYVMANHKMLARDDCCGVCPPCSCCPPVPDCCPPCPVPNCCPCPPPKPCCIYPPCCPKPPDCPGTCPTPVACPCKGCVHPEPPPPCPTPTPPICPIPPCGCIPYIKPRPCCCMPPCCIPDPCPPPRPPPLCAPPKYCDDDEGYRAESATVARDDYEQAETSQMQAKTQNNPVQEVNKLCAASGPACPQCCFAQCPPCLAPPPCRIPSYCMQPTCCDADFSFSPVDMAADCQQQQQQQQGYQTMNYNQDASKRMKFDDAIAFMLNRPRATRRSRRNMK